MYNRNPTCVVSRCPEYAVHESRCKNHQRTPFRSGRKERLPADWNFRREQVLKRDKGICYLCGQPGADSVDHIVAGDDHSYDNLAAAHQRVAPYCHRRKTAQDGHRAKRAQEPEKPGSYWVREYHRRQAEKENNDNS